MAFHKEIASHPHYSMFTPVISLLPTSHTTNIAYADDITQIISHSYNPNYCAHATQKGINTFAKNNGKLKETPIISKSFLYTEITTHALTITTKFPTHAKGKFWSWNLLYPITVLDQATRNKALAEQSFSKMKKFSGLLQHKISYHTKPPFF